MRPTGRGSVAGTQSQGITKLLLAWSQGEQAALDKLVPRVHAELRRVAHRYMARERPGQTLQTTALVNEAYLRLINARQVGWQNRAHFFAVSAQLMRRILVDFARSQNYSGRCRRPKKPGSGIALLWRFERGGNRRGAESFPRHRYPRLAAGQGLAGAGDGESGGE